MSELNSIIQTDDNILDNLVTQIQSNELQDFKTKDISLTISNSFGNCDPNYIPPKKRKRENYTKNHEFYEVTIPAMTLDDFRQTFHMSRSCCQAIMTRVANRVRVFNMERKFLFTLWMLTTHESFSVVGQRFGLAKGPSHQFFRDIMDGLIVLFKEYVSWPSVVELSHIEQGFKPKSGGYVPGIVGAINSCHLLIKKPARYSIYCNPRGTHSMILQAVCDHQKIFTDVYVGAPGCLVPERVFNNSPLSKVLNELLPEHFHIVGNVYFPQKQNLVVPFLDEYVVNESQRVFNECLSKANSTAEEAFKLLLARFHRLTFLDTANPEMANKIVVSCIILHNHILMTDLDEDPNTFIKEWPELYINQDPKGITASDDDFDGIEKRNYLLSLFGYI